MVGNENSRNRRYCWRPGFSKISEATIKDQQENQWQLCKCCVENVHWNTAYCTPKTTYMGHKRVHRKIYWLFAYFAWYVYFRTKASIFFQRNLSTRGVAHYPTAEHYQIMSPQSIFRIKNKALTEFSLAPLNSQNRVYTSKMGNGNGAPMKKGT